MDVFEYPLPLSRHLMPLKMSYLYQLLLTCCDLILGRLASEISVVDFLEEFQRIFFCCGFPVDSGD